MTLRAILEALRINGEEENTDNFFNYYNISKIFDKKLKNLYINLLLFYF